MTTNKCIIFVLHNGQIRSETVRALVECGDFRVRLVEGIDARVSDIASFEGAQSDFSFSDFKRRHNREALAGEVACLLGHREIYKQIMQERISHALILEDDAEFHLEELPEALRDLSTILNSNKPRIVSLFTFEAIIPFGHERLSSSKKVYKLINRPNTTLAYGVNWQMCREMLSNRSRIDTTADWPNEVARVEFLFSNEILMSLKTDLSHSQMNRQGDVKDTAPFCAQLALIVEIFREMKSLKHSGIGLWRSLLLVTANIFGRRCRPPQYQCQRE